MVSTEATDRSQHHGPADQQRRGEEEHSAERVQRLDAVLLQGRV